MLFARLVTSMPTMPTDLGTLIATERQRLGWSLRAMSSHGGPAYNTLSMIERGEVKKPDAETLYRIATAFADGGSASLGEWFARLLRVAGYPLDPEVDAVIARLVSVLTPDRRQQILDMSPEELDQLLSLRETIRRGAGPPQ